MKTNLAAKLHLAKSFHQDTATALTALTEKGLDPGQLNGPQSKVFNQLVDTLKGSASVEALGVTLDEALSNVSGEDGQRGVKKLLLETVSHSLKGDERQSQQFYLSMLAGLVTLNEGADPQLYAFICEFTEASCQFGEKEEVSVLVDALWLAGFDSIDAFQDTLRGPPHLPYAMQACSTDIEEGLELKQSVLQESLKLEATQRQSGLDIETLAVELADELDSFDDGASESGDPLSPRENIREKLRDANQTGFFEPEHVKNHVEYKEKKLDIIAETLATVIAAMPEQADQIGSWDSLDAMMTGTQGTVITPAKVLHVLSDHLAAAADDPAFEGFPSGFQERVLGAANISGLSTGESMLYAAESARGNFRWTVPSEGDFAAIMDGAKVTQGSSMNCWEAQLLTLAMSDQFSLSESKALYNFAKLNALPVGRVLNDALTHDMGSTLYNGFETLPNIVDDLSPIEPGKTYFLMMDRRVDRAWATPDGAAHFGVYYPVSVDGLSDSQAYGTKPAQVEKPEDGIVSNHWSGWTDSFDHTDLETFTSAKCESVRVLEVDVGIANMRAFIADVVSGHVPYTKQAL